MQKNYETNLFWPEYQTSFVRYISYLVLDPALRKPGIHVKIR